MLDTTQLQELWGDIYQKAQEAWLTVRSGSMVPMIQVGDRVLVKPIQPRHIHFGDIVVFKEADKMVVHRVMGRREGHQGTTFLQKGDSNTVAAHISVESVIGKVVCIRKGDRHIRLDGLLGSCVNFLLGTCFYILYALRKWPLASRLSRLFHCCLNNIFG